MARKPKKYSPEIKMKAIEDYQAGKGSLRRICKKYGIKDHKTLREWISCYNGQKIFRKRSGARGEIYMTKGRKTTQEERTQIVAFCIEHSSTFGVTLIAMTMITTIVILAVTSNVVLSLGMVGALSIVRFRTAIKEPLDIAFLFWSIGVGIVLAAGMIPLAVFGSMVVGMTLLVFVNKKSYTHPYILVLNCDGQDSENAAKEYIIPYVERSIVKSKTAQAGSVELNLEVRLKEDNTDFVNGLSQLEGVRSAVLVSYNGDYMG